MGTDATRERILRGTYSLVGTFLLTLSALLATFAFGVRPVRVSGVSMEPNLRNGRGA